MKCKKVADYRREMGVVEGIFKLFGNIFNAPSDDTWNEFNAFHWLSEEKEGKNLLS